jgi:hypothetical protein
MTGQGRKEADMRLCDMLMATTVRLRPRGFACSSGSAGASGLRQLYDVLHF